jgi:hypothetical protein
VGRRAARIADAGQALQPELRATAQAPVDRGASLHRMRRQGRSFFNTQHGTPASSTQWGLGAIGVGNWRGVPLARPSAWTSALMVAPAGGRPGCVGPCRTPGCAGSTPGHPPARLELHALGVRHQLGRSNPAGDRTVQHARLPVLGDRQAPGHRGKLAPTGEYAGLRPGSKASNGRRRRS